MRRKLLIAFCISGLQLIFSSPSFGDVSGKAESLRYRDPLSAQLRILSTADKYMKCGENEKADIALKNYLLGPGQKLENTEKAVFFQDLSSIFDSNGRKKDGAAAWGQAENIYSTVKVASPTLTVGDIQELGQCLKNDQNALQFSEVVLDVPNQKLERLITKGAVDDAKASVLRGAQKRLADELVGALGEERLLELREHVISTSAGGTLSRQSLIQSSAEQVDCIFRKLEFDAPALAKANNGVVDLVIYAHGGLTPEPAALKTAAMQLPWWKANHCYPIFLAWQSGMEEMLADQEGWTILRDLTAPGSLISLVDMKATEFLNAPPEICDSKLEDYARKAISRLWNDMKLKSLSLYDKRNTPIDWNSPLKISPDTPAGNVLVSRLVKAISKISALPTKPSVRLHLVGHSAGSIALSGLLDHLVSQNLKVDSIDFLAPAITVTEFEARFPKHLRSGFVKRLSIFNLSDEYEKSDPNTRVAVFKYNKSLLYLVSRALEPAPPGVNEIAILGMQKFFKEPVYKGSPVSLEEDLRAINADSFCSPPPENKRVFCNASTHGGFGEEPNTLDTVMKKISHRDQITPFRHFVSQP